MPIRYSFPDRMEKTANDLPIRAELDHCDLNFAPLFPQGHPDILIFFIFGI